MDTPPIWWGILLIGIGLSSGLLGVLFALAQHNLKRLLAYHSIENIGIIAMGMGVGLLALSEGLYSIAILGFAGAILHVMNHAAFKGLLFLGAGSVFHSTGQHDMDNQGGLIKRMPVTGVTFLIGAAAIAGLPPLNGFVSELLIFLGAFKGSVNTSVTVTMSLVALIGGLGLIGGLAIACFTKAYGVVFLGEPRTDKAANAHDGGPLVQIPLLALAVICVFIGVFPLISIRIVLPVVSQIAGVPIEAAEFTLIGITSPFVSVTISAMIVICISIFITLLRIGILARKEVRTSVTWDCGYEFPSARMQYTSSSFAQPVMHIFHKILRTRVQLHAAEGYFPRQASLHSDTPDVFTNRLYQPMAIWIEGVSSRLRWLQQGRIHIYLLYIFVTLIVLLVWKLGF
jgi:NADH:ubiquinone oxidoreductase subunit 5 (subunit L)/multisubunit Na+/H+ antiporter MnhA subunit